MKTNLSVEFSRTPITARRAGWLQAGLLVGTGLLGLAQATDAAILVTYNIAGTAAGANTVAATVDPLVAAQINADPLSLGGGISRGANAQVADTFLATGWTQNDFEGYYQFTVTPNPGFSISFDTITGSLVTEFPGLNGPDLWNLRSSVDGYNVVLGNTDLLTAASGEQVPFTYDVSSLGTQNGAVTFRLYGFDATDPSLYGGLANHANDVNFSGTGADLVINGTVVPEPHQYAMMAALGLLGFAAIRRYHFQRA